jgi:hypothetical protein
MLECAAPTQPRRIDSQMTRWDRQQPRKRRQRLGYLLSGMGLHDRPFLCAAWIAFLFYVDAVLGDTQRHRVVRKPSEPS